MLKTILRGLLFRLLGYVVLVLGFWLLLLGFQRPNIPLGILGGALIPVGMYLIVTARRRIQVTGNPPPDENEQGEDVDSIDRSG